MRSARLIWLVFVIVLILLYLYLYSAWAALLPRFWGSFLTAWMRCSLPSRLLMQPVGVSRPGCFVVRASGVDGGFRMFEAALYPPQWRAIRRAKLAQAGFCCEECG